MKISIATVLSAAAGLANAVALVPPPGEVELRLFQHSGNACPQGSSGTTATINSITLSITQSTIAVSTGSNELPSERSKNCAVYLTVAYPPGYQFATLDPRIKGFAVLSLDTSVAIWYTVFFSKNARDMVTSVRSLSGRQFLYGAGFEIPSANGTDLVWSSCGGEDVLNVNTRLALTQEQDGSATVWLEEVTDIVWRSC